jgi:diguanylate cyclase (GGDEF)-like protein
VLARIGGDEFAVLIPGCSHADAADLSSRLRALMPRPYTCSIGLATWEPPEPPDHLMARADNALYNAKRNGHDGQTGQDPQRRTTRLVVADRIDP